MGISVKRNRVTIEDEELDIYIASELKKALLTLQEKKKKKVVLDLGRVESLSTAGLQVIISASRSFNDFKVEGLRPSLLEMFKNMRIEF